MKRVQDAKFPVLLTLLPYLEFFGQPFGKSSTRSEEERQDLKFASGLTHVPGKKLLHDLGLHAIQQGRIDGGRVKEADGMNFQAREKSGNSGYASQVEGRTCLKRAVVDKQINCTFQAFPIDEPVHTRKKIINNRSNWEF